MYDPSAAANLYGISVSSDIAWVQVAGLRDLGLGVASASIYRLEPRAMRVYAPTLLLVPLGDVILTLKHGTVLGALTHCGGIVAIGILSICAWLNPELSLLKRE